MDFDFLPSNLQIAYPFQQNVEVQRYGADTYLAPIVAAAQVRTADQRDEALLVERIYLETSDDFATFDEAYIKLKWGTSGDVVELDEGAGTCTAVVQAYGSWVAVEWWGPQELSGSLTMAVKMVFPSSAIEDAGPFKVIEITEKSDALTLHSSLIKQGPGEVRRVYWKYGNTLELVADRGEPLILGAGFNMAIAPAEEDTTGFQAAEFTLVEGRPQTTLELNAVPGAGQGKYLLCPGSLYILTVNGVEPNSKGELQLRPINCYWLERQLQNPTDADGEHGITYNASLKANELQIKNGCEPCCSCEDYLATYTHLRELWDRAQIAAAGFNETRARVSAIVALYEAVQQSTKPDVIGLDLNEDQDQLIVQLAYVNESGDLKNPEETWDSDPLKFEVTFGLEDEDGNPIPGTTFTYKSGSGIAVNGRASEEIGADQSGSEDATVEIDSLEVMPYTVLFWVGKFLMDPAPSGGQVITATAISSGGGTETRTGSAFVVVEGVA